MAAFMKLAKDKKITTIYFLKGLLYAHPYMSIIEVFKKDLTRSVRLTLVFTKFVVLCAISGLFS
jgi:hypothetical protein